MYVRVWRANLSLNGPANFCASHFRPENTHKNAEAVRQADLNLLYWSDEETTLEANDVCGKCEVVCGEDLEGDKDDWFTSQTDRFYFYEAYNSKTKTFEDPPYHARTTGGSAKGKGKGGKGKVTNKWKKKTHANKKYSYMTLCTG